MSEGHWTDSRLGQAVHDAVYGFTLDGSGVKLCEILRRIPMASQLHVTLYVNFDQLSQKA
jgi:hypothetical protein